MRVLINYLLIIISIIHKIKSIPEFKAIKIDKENILIINQKGIYKYDKNLNLYTIFNFGSSLHLSPTDIKNIPFFTHLGMFFSY